MTICESDLEAICHRLQKRIGSGTFDAFLSDAKFEADRDGTKVRIYVPSRFKASKLEELHHDDIEREISLVLGKTVNLTIECGAQPEQADAQRFCDPDGQYNMVMLPISEVKIKEDMHLMGIAPFTLQPRGETRTRLTYKNIDGMDIDIKAHPDYGLPTPTDHDIVLFMESWLAAQANHYRKALAYYAAQKAAGRQAEKPTPPPRVWRPTVVEIMEFTRDHDAKLGKRYGGKQVSVLEQRLDRLKNTNAKIRQTGTRKRRIGTFSYIGDWSVISETETGNIEQVEIEIPDWIYQGIVEAEKPTILTFDDDYELIKQPIMKVLYRVLRAKATGKEEAIPLEELHRRSGSRQPLKEFNRTLIERVGETERQGFFDWGLSIRGSDRQRELVATPKHLMSDDT